MKNLISQLFLFSFGLAMFSCNNWHVANEKLDVCISKDGSITKMKIPGKKLTIPVNVFTKLAGCREVGKTTVRKKPDHSVEFEKTLVNDSLKTSCIVIDRFIPTENSIRWEIEVKGEGDPWATEIETRIVYPAGQGTKMWTAWGAPQFDAAKTGSNLLASLQNHGGALKDKEFDENIHIFKWIDPLISVAGIDPYTKSNPSRAYRWIDPLVPVPFLDTTYYYGAVSFNHKDNMVASIPFQGNLMCIPMISILEDGNDFGMTIALSPEDDVIDMVMKTTEKGEVTFTRMFNRISKGSPVRFVVDITTHESDWRPGLSWMCVRYPGYFFPKNPLAHQLGGTGAYAAYSKSDIDMEKMKKMAFTVNWQASFDFPYMGMFLPPVKPDEAWTRFGGGSLTINEMDNYALKFRQSGLYVLNYFNVTEFGAHIKFPPPARTNVLEQDLWKDCNDFLYTKLKNAILPVPEKSIRKEEQKNSVDPVPYYTWEGGIAMDCGDLAYRNFLLEQARRHVSEIPNSFGICIDRLDWLRMFNERADDGITWFDGKPVRSLLTSWKRLATQLGPVMHEAGKVIFVNNHDKRIDILEQADGIFDEFTYAGTPLNTTALLCIYKPALGWTDDARTIETLGGDVFFQKYLYMGVFPMCPFPDNDHSVSSTPYVDKIYLDYGPLMELMKGREWVLKPHVIEVENNLAKANIFKMKNGYSIPVVYGGDNNAVKVVLTGLDDLENKFSCMAVHPGIKETKEVKYTRNGNKIILDVPLERGCAMVFLKRK